jgi:site-specific DNA-methyltransferase (adenine-specific)
MINLYNVDCMEFMRGLPDKHYSLCIVDPPYGIGAADDDRFGVKTSKAGSARTAYARKAWDGATPPAEYFDELRRVSRNQIVWGANYFGLIGGMLFWHKNQTEYSSSSGELAHLSMATGVHYVDILWHGAYQQDMRNKERRIHPTQKPVALYRWLLQNYAKPGDRILDTHGGSMSSAIAADIEGFDMDICELDKDYFEAGKKRLEQHQAQPRLFDAPKAADAVQLTLDGPTT